MKKRCTHRTMAVMPETLRVLDSNKLSRTVFQDLPMQEINNNNSEDSLSAMHAINSITTTKCSSDRLPDLDKGGMMFGSNTSVSTEIRAPQNSTHLITSSNTSLADNILCEVISITIKTVLDGT